MCVTEASAVGASRTQLAACRQVNRAVRGECQRPSEEEFPRSRTCGEASRPRRAGSDLGSHGFRLIDEGTLFNAGQQTGIASNVLIVPAEVVQHGQNGLYVFIVDDQNRA